MPFCLTAQAYVCQRSWWTGPKQAFLPQIGPKYGLLYTPLRGCSAVMYKKGWGISDLPQWLNTTRPFFLKNQKNLTKKNIYRYIYGGEETKERTGESGPHKLIQQGGDLALPQRLNVTMPKFSEKYTKAVQKQISAIRWRRSSSCPVLTHTMVVQG